MKPHLMKYSNILQVDDDPDDCEMFHETLLTIGIAAYTAINNPVEAMKKLRSGKVHPDVIILDVNMPMMNGMEFLQLLKNNDQLHDIPVIVFSTCSESATKRRALEAGALKYITKPVTFSLLQQTLRKILL
jgi:CheY-like chemotaxis protein